MVNQRTAHNGECNSSIIELLSARVSHWAILVGLFSESHSVNCSPYTHTKYSGWVFTKRTIFRSRYPRRVSLVYPLDSLNNHRTTGSSMREQAERRKNQFDLLFATSMYSKSNLDPPLWAVREKARLSLSETHCENKKVLDGIRWSQLVATPSMHYGHIQS